MSTVLEIPGKTAIWENIAPFAIKGWNWHFQNVVLNEVSLQGNLNTTRYILHC